MKKLLTAVLLASACSLAAAQTGGLPPEQAPTGNPGKLQTPKQVKAAKTAAAAGADVTPVASPATASGGKAARKAKREAKVGDKPLN